MSSSSWSVNKAIPALYEIKKNDVKIVELKQDNLSRLHTKKNDVGPLEIEWV